MAQPCACTRRSGATLFAPVRVWVLRCRRADAVARSGRAAEGKATVCALAGQLTWTGLHGSETGTPISASLRVADNSLGLPAKLRHSREITLLCSPKVTHHHDQLGGVLPPGKSVVLPAGQELTARQNVCAGLSCPPPQSNRLRLADSFSCDLSALRAPWRG